MKRSTRVSTLPTGSLGTICSAVVSVPSITEGLLMNGTFANFRQQLSACLAALALALPVFPAEQPKVDATPAQTVQKVTVADLNQSPKAGLFKLTEADVVNLVGPPATVKRPGDAGADLQLHLEYAT